MSKPITLELPETLLERAEQTAEQMGRPVELILVEWLERGAEWDMSAVYPVYTPYGNEHLAAALEKFLEDESSNTNVE